MKIEDKYRELADRYLRNQLDEDELTAFQDLLDSNSEFREYFKEMKGMVEGIKTSARQELMNQLQKTEEGLDKISIEKNESKKTISIGKRSNRTIVLNTLRITAVAASLTALYFGIGQQVIQESGIPEPFRDIHDVSSATRSNNIDNDAQYQEAFDYYQSNKFGKTIQQLKSIKEKNGEIWLVLGNSYFSTKRFKKAAKCYAPENFNNAAELREVAMFYRALCLMALRNYSEAEKLLLEVVENNDIYEYEASKILESKRFKH